MITETLWLLIGLQMVMGITDTLVHHEFTERLAWRATAAKELRLHAVRNWFYSGVFAMLGFAWPGGAIALLLLVVLVIEVGITLWDFVEEDVSRRLPATERVLHTLLALNYGGILVLLVPELWTATAAPTGLEARWYGVGSLMCAVAAVGTLGFGCRDWFASRRAAKFRTVPAGRLKLGLGQRRHVLVTGATGFIGQRLVAALVAEGHRVTALVRGGACSRAGLPTPVCQVASLNEIAEDERIDAIVNLAGAPVAAGPWTQRRRLTILRSRLRTTRDVVRLVERLETKPAVLVSGSAIGFYGYESDAEVGEEAARGEGFAARLCAAWEREAAKAEAYGLRVVMLRIGVVLGREGGMLAGMLPAYDLCLGGRIGSGRQWLSWIGLDDVVRLIAFSIAHEEMSGPVNATAPRPVTNAQFAAELGHALGRPVLLPVPAALLSLGLGDLGREIVLGSQRVVPLKALAAGFTFPDGDLAALLQRECGSAKARSSGNRREVASYSAQNIVIGSP